MFLEMGYLVHKHIIICDYKKLLGKKKKNLKKFKLSKIFK